MTTLQIGEEIYLELDSPSDASISLISWWIRTNVGMLNNLLDIGFTVDSAETFDPTPSESVKIIYKKLFLVYFYNKKALSNLGAAALNLSIDVSSDGARVRRISKNDISKTYNLLKNSAQKELNDLVNAYRLGSVDPLAIVGPDTSEIQEDLIGRQTLVRT